MVHFRATSEVNIEAKSEDRHDTGVAAEGFPIVRHPPHGCPATNRATNGTAANH